MNGWPMTAMLADRPLTRDSMRAIRLTLLISALSLGLFAGAAAAQEPIPWNQLTAEQQALLQKVQPKWDRLPPGQQQRMLHGAERWSKMSDAERAEAKARMDRWKAMSPKERRALRERANLLHDLSPEQRERLRGLRKDFRALPEEAQRAFRDCEHRRRAGETLDCRGLWPPEMREKYADLPDPWKKKHGRRGEDRPDINPGLYTPPG